MSLISSPVMLFSSRRTSLVFQTITRKTYLREKMFNWVSFVRADRWCANTNTYFLAFRGVMLNGGPGGPKLLGKTSTHIWSFPCSGREDEWGSAMYTFMLVMIIPWKCLLTCLVASSSHRADSMLRLSELLRFQLGVSTIPHVILPQINNAKNSEGGRDMNS